MITLKNLDKFYGETQVLTDINLTVNRGEVVSIIGPSGAGKSTLLRCINLMEVPTNGDILINDEKIHYKVNKAGGLTFLTRMKLTHLRSKVGMVFQGFNLWSAKTILGNVTEGLCVCKKMRKKEAEKIALRELERVGLKDKASAYPANLSGGQQQRVAIARALAMGPEAILFDEPTSALDPELVKEVLDIIIQLAKEGLTMLVVTHEMNFARYVSNRVIFMERGKIAMDDTPENVFGSEDPRMKSFLHSMSSDSLIKK